MTVVRYKVDQGIAWLAMNNPPLNALSHALRAGIVTALDRALAAKNVRAIVLIGAERAFSSGADIKEFAGGEFFAEPFLPAVIDMVEASEYFAPEKMSAKCRPPMKKTAGISTPHLPGTGLSHGTMHTSTAI